MNNKITALLDSIKELEDAVEAELGSRRAELRFTILHRRVQFEEAALLEHRRLKTGLIRYFRQVPPRDFLTAPIVYSLIIPLAALDLCVTFYQATCFPIYGIPKVRRDAYLIFDRSNLAYLNVVERFHCFYCSYANGLISYTKEIVALTEQYFCPIKHARRVLHAHSRYNRFVDFGDAEAYRRELEKIRADFDKAKKQ